MEGTPLQIRSFFARPREVHKPSHQSIEQCFVSVIMSQICLLLWLYCQLYDLWPFGLKLGQVLLRKLNPISLKYRSQSDCYPFQYWHLLLLRGLVGIGEASYAALAPPIIADLIPAAQRTFYLSFFFIGTPVGGFIYTVKFCARMCSPILFPSMKYCMLMFNQLAWKQYKSNPNGVVLHHQIIKLFPL